MGSTLSTVCTAGNYCPTGVSAPMPCPQGTFSNSTGLISSSLCVPCTGGYYCDGFGMISPRGLSSPGYYCVQACKSATPPYGISVVTSGSNTNAMVGGPCPKGFYCETGSSMPTHCPAGTFSNVTGLQIVDDCIPCPSSYYCESEGATGVTGLCDAGYYCDGYATNARQNPTPPGYYSIAGSSASVPCDPGFYNSLWFQSACVACPSGYYCSSNSMSTYTNICVPGSYCPGQTVTPIQCSPGTFSSTEGNYEHTQCLSCTPGSYCDSYGLPTVSGPCDAGYWCSGGASVKSSANTLINVGPCPIGHYCLQGTDTPIPCPIGTFMPTMGSNVCTECTPGYYCATTGLSAVTGQCAARFYCTGGATTSTQLMVSSSGGPCPVGNYCVKGTSDPVPCTDGTYMNHTGSSACLQAPAGYYADPTISTSRFFECPIGKYCPQGTGASIPSCPVGRYGRTVMLEAVDDCTSCPAGASCSSTGLPAPDGGCSTGYYCPQGSLSIFGQTVYATSNQCPKGYYCPENSVEGIPCPIGTYNPAVGASTCLDCPPGRFCANISLVMPMGYCSAGFWCSLGSSVLAPMTVAMNPLTSNPGGGQVCNAGTYCPAGVLSPLGCPPGTYNDLPNQS